MKIIEGLIQGTPEWHEFRRQHIGASEVGAILGLNPFRTKQSVWEEKVLGWEQSVNDKMREGTKNEEEARKAYEELVEFPVFPMVAECEKHPFLSASFDGLSEMMDRAVEIKCGASSHRSALCGFVPIYYESQLQHQMYIADLKEIDYFSYRDKEGILLKIERDDEFIKNMLEKLIQFWYHVQAGTLSKD